MLYEFNDYENRLIDFSSIESCALKDNHIIIDCIKEQYLLEYEDIDEAYNDYEQFKRDLKKSNNII